MEMMDGVIASGVTGVVTVLVGAAVVMHGHKVGAAQKKAEDAKERGESAEAIQDIYKKSGVTAFSRKTGILIILGIVLLIVSVGSVGAVRSHHAKDQWGNTPASRCQGCWRCDFF